MKRLDAFQIKALLLILMLLDHLWFAFPGVFPAWIHAITRCVSVMFAYFLVEGFFYTRSRKKYGIRLFIWAVFMQLGNLGLNSILSSKGVKVNFNIFATLFVGFVVMCFFEYSKNKNLVKKIIFIIIGVLAAILGVFYTEGGNILMPFIIITYCFRGDLKKTFIGYMILEIPIFLLSFQIYPTIKKTYDMAMVNSEFLFILVIPLILLYSGKRGLNNKFSKYMFYVVYPLHLWIIAIIKYFII